MIAVMKLNQIFHCSTSERISCSIPLLLEISNRQVSRTVKSLLLTPLISNKGVNVK